MAYDNKYKKRAIEYHEEGNSIRQTAKVFHISANTLNTWIQQYSKNGEFIQKKRVYKHKVEDEKLLAYIEENPDSYQAEISEALGCSQPTISRSLKRLNITRKKR